MKKRVGMGLVELTVAMAVMMLVVGFVMGLMFELSKNWKKVSDYWMVMRPAQLVLEGVCSDLGEMRYYDLETNQMLVVKPSEDAYVFDKSINGHVLHFHIVPMSRAGMKISRDESLDWFDVRMEVCSNASSNTNQVDAGYTFRRKVIVQARL